MRIQLASDLHLEFFTERLPGLRLVEPGSSVDVLVLAGDIACGTAAIELFADWPVPSVLYVPGNHEFYGPGRTWEGTRRDLKAAAAGTKVTVLDNDAVVIAGVRVLGTTLWTDFELDGQSPEDGMAPSEAVLMDYRAIRLDDGRLARGSDTLRDHRASRAWLERTLVTPFDGKTVVITHHGPHPLSVHPRYRGNPVNPGFVSDLTALVEQADLWLHGHVHDSFDYRVRDSRVVANPAGYVLNRRMTNDPTAFRLENPAFEPRLVIEL